MSKIKINKYTREQLMLEAIEEARKSVPEHTDKTDPMVGAIIANAEGVILARAHRGELREGEHCEYTLIERKLAGENLRGCSLFVTLEPCTDDSRKKPKRGCSTHIVKARLAEIFVGVEDPNPKIATKGIKFLESKGIKVTMFPDHLEQIIRGDNAQFIKEKEIEALQASKPVSLPVKGLLERQAPAATHKSFSREAIKEFIAASEAPFTYPSSEFDQWAAEFGFVERDLKGNSFPTGLGLMLFGAEPEKQFPQTIFKVEIDYGDQEPEIKDFNGPLIQQLPEVLNYVRDKALRLTINRADSKRTVDPDFPFNVLREAIANAVIHRDYTQEGATNYLFISHDKIVLRSPGGPMEPLTIDDLRSFDTPSLSRNPKIMFVFNMMKMAEQRGIGLRNMRKLPGLGYPLPTIETSAGTLEITFGRIKKFVSINKKIDQQLSDQDRQTLIFIQKFSEISAPDLVENFGMTPKTAQRHLAKLVELELVDLLGRGRWTKYKIKSTGLSKKKIKS